MKRRKLFRIIFIPIAILLILGLFFPTWTPPIKHENNSISTLKQVKINGTKHEIMIRGNDKNNPIIIFVHGGPGCPEIPYVRKYQDILEENFTVVQYDQRATGKSFHFFEDYSKLSINLLRDDLLALTDYIIKYLGSDKVILVGHSFGTVVGIKAANKAPDKYIAYVGVGQVGDFWTGELEALEYCLVQSQEQKNFRDAEKIEKCRSGIVSRTESFPRKYIRKYKGAARQINESADITKGLLFNTEYNLLDAIRYGFGLKISNDILWEELKGTNLTEEVNQLCIPCYFTTGIYDYLTPSQSAKEYLDTITAPKKEFIEFQNSAHYPHFEEKEKFARLIFNIANSY